MTRRRGRFRKPLDPEALAFSSSLEVDQRLYREDIEGSLAHVAMLARRGILSARDARRIAQGLRAIRREIAGGSFRPAAAAHRGVQRAADDIHMAIEERLIRKIGQRGGFVHTARSRNDQVALDERLYLRRQIELILRALTALQKSLVGSAWRHRTVIMPGTTHLQHAQPVLLAHHLLAYVEMLDRDAARFRDCLGRANVSPLGAAALAGTSFPIDRKLAARVLGFDGVVANSIDAVSDRDALVEFVAACAIVMMHLSRLAEELVRWSSQEWAFASIAEEFTTGSSIMPQKKNPDIAELVRGKTGRVYGDLIALLTVMKGLPLAYNRDLQEDKPPLFDAADTVRASLAVCARMMKRVRFQARRFEREMDGQPLLATELADYLVQRGVPFRRAHAIVGGIVAECERSGRTLRELPLAAYRRHSALFTADVTARLTARASIEAKVSLGSTSSRHVRAALQRWRRRLSL